MPYEPHQTGAETLVTAERGRSFRALHRKLEDALATIEQSENVSETLENILDESLRAFHDELGFDGGRIYKREGDDFYLCCGFGKSRQAPVGLRVPRDYVPHRRTLAEGVLVMRSDEPGIDHAFERRIGVESTFAAIAVGAGHSHVIAFSVRGEVREEQILYSLSAMRHVINLKLQQQRVSTMLDEARAIQESLLPTAAPSFAGFELEGRARPTEIVGGDLFDYLPLPGQRLGVAIADATGHGLPSALLARDVITGLRMGASEPLTIERLMERLNEVIHRAALASTFISLFYGELSQDGTVRYCNAGHHAPLLLRSGSFLELDRGGMVLGPIPGSRFESGRVRLVSGDLLLMYTDGLLERENDLGDPFGATRLKQLLLGGPQRTAPETIESVFGAIDEHARGAAQGDDMTIVVVRKL
ncbi:MAG: PP2C family protein-serine/threonine phosphatase [Acidobacteriota bacterium]|nr:MAG: PP2C family protein-serine/threonine phosphatase [Acidobacteriota bacterium]